MSQRSQLQLAARRKTKMVRVLSTIIVAFNGAAAAYSTCEVLSSGTNLALCLSPTIALVAGAIAFWSTKTRKVRPAAARSNVGERHINLCRQSQYAV